jgi:acyl carrier protein
MTHSARSYVAGLAPVGRNAQSKESASRTGDGVESELLEREISQLIIETLTLEDVKVTDIDPQAPLFVTGLGLDSIDALELGVAMQKKYGVRLSADSSETKRHFSSVRALASLVATHRAGAAS